MKSVCSMLCAVLIFSALAGCVGNPAAEAPEPSKPETVASSSSSLPEPATEAPKPTLPPDTVFTPREPVNLMAVNEAAQWVRQQLDTINDTDIPIPEATDFSDRFNEGNAAYRSGDYQLARTVYLDIIADCPAHTGAINNLALTLIRLEDYQQALGYCILNRVLNPGFYAGWINLQVAGHALGLRPSLLQELLNDEFTDFPDLLSYQDEIEEDFPDQSVWDAAIMVAYLYNAVYADMEYEPVLDDVTMMELGVKLEIGELTEEEYEEQTLELYMDSLEESMNAMAESHPDDEDIRLLLDYLTALRTLRERQLGAAAEE